MWGSRVISGTTKTETLGEKRSGKTPDKKGEGLII
jgi:hypothetical protein